MSAVLDRIAERRTEIVAEQEKLERLHAEQFADYVEAYAAGNGETVAAIGRAAGFSYRMVWKVVVEGAKEGA